MLVEQHLAFLAVLLLVCTESVTLLENVEGNLEIQLNNAFLESESVDTVLHGASNFKSGIPRCDQDIKRLADALLKKEEWALKVVDSSSYFIPGILNGNIGGLGNFDECLKISRPQEEFSHWALYSLVEVRIERKIPLNFARQDSGDAIAEFLSELLAAIQNETFSKRAFSGTERFVNETAEGSAQYLQNSQYANNGSMWQPLAILHLGICFPRSCGTEVPRKFVELTFSPLDDALIKSNYYLKFLPPRHQDELVGLPAKFTIADWCVIVFCALLVSLIGFSTFLDLCERGNSDQKMAGWKTCLLSFSLYTNGRKLFSVECDSANSHLYAINGLRVITMMWLVLVHRGVLQVMFFIPVTNLMDVREKLKKDLLTRIIILTGGVAVEAFFTLGGILNSYQFLKYMEVHKKLSILKYIVHRYLRFIPMLAFVTSVAATWLYHLGSGPFWNKIVGEERRKCQKLWWSNILFIANYFQYESTDLVGSFPCIDQSWFVMASMQLYCFSLLVLLPLWYWRKVGIAWLSFLIALSGAIPTTIAYIYGFRIPTPLYLGGDSKLLLHYLYLPTYSRASSYLVGLLIGYLLYRARSNFSDFRLGSKSIALGWICSFVFGLIVILGLLLLYDLRHHVDGWISAVYLGFYGMASGVCIGWIVFVCATGRGGRLNAFLSCYPFRVLSRLVYGIYLTHITLQAMDIATSRTPLYVSVFGVARQMILDFMLSTLWAGLLALGLEFPLSALEKIALERRPEKVKPTANSNDTIVQIKEMDLQIKTEL